MFINIFMVINIINVIKIAKVINSLITQFDGINIYSCMKGLGSRAAVDQCLFHQIFETFGPVKNPFYSLLTNNEQELAPSLAPGQLIYVVPNNQTLTRYVFTTELMKYVECV